MRQLLQFFSAMCIGVCLILTPGVSFASLETAQTLVAKLDKIGIDENTSPEIKRLYDELTGNLQEAQKLYDNYKSDLQDNLQAMKDTEQSATNRMIGAVGIGATGIGGMQALSAVAEQNADKQAEQDMKAYLATFRCDFGQGRNINGGEKGIELPGANSLTQMVIEYTKLAEDLKVRKQALGMEPGIESEHVISAADTGLYDNVSLGKTDGAYASLSRALTDKEGEDASEISEQKDKTAKKLKTGATVAGVGAAGSMVANLVANKDAPKEQSEKIKNQYDSDKQKLETKVNDTETRLNAEIGKNKQKIDEYNKLLAAHKAFVDSIRNTECAKVLTEYIAYIDSLKPIENELVATDNLEIKYDLETQKQIYQQCVDLEKQRAECIANPAKEWIDNKCVDKVMPVTDTSEDAEIVTVPTTDEQPEPEPEEEVAPVVVDEDQCPADNPRMPSFNENTRVGDFCSYENVATGHVTKYKSGKYKGTCTCTADTCKPGYKLENYRCDTRIPDGPCPTVSIDGSELQIQTNENQSLISGPVAGFQRSVKSFTMGQQACEKSCKARAQQNNCIPYGSHRYDIKTGKCTCNYVTDCAEKEYAYNDAVKSVGDVKDKMPVEVCNLFCAEKSKSQQCNIGASRYENNKCICNYRDRGQLGQKLKYYKVCQGDLGPGGGSHNQCIKVFKSINVQILQARTLAQEYLSARPEHYKNREIYCKNDDYTRANDDYIMCTSIDGNYFYDFQFDDVYESIDADIQFHTRRALCEIIYNGSGSSYCTGIDETNCTKGAFAASASKLGFETKWNKPNVQGAKPSCAIMSRNEDLAIVDGIDPYFFYTGIQIQANGTIVDNLREYVRREYSGFYQLDCDSNPRQATKIANGRAVSGSTDDILRCKINAQTPIDFVFDDMSEFSTRLSRGGYQNIDCKVVGGEYNGRECMYLSKEQCLKLSSQNATNCPSCRKINWDAKRSLCVMPNAADATQLQKDIDANLIIGGAVVGIVVTVLTGGTGTVALGLLAIETAGAVVEVAADEAINIKVRNFLLNSQKCKDAQCAESMLKENLQAMANFADDVPDAQVNGIDSELARLAELIPEDSDFYRQLATKGVSTSDNQKDWTDPDAWEPEEIWRAAGQVMQVASLITGLWKWAATKLTKTTKVLQDIAKNADNIQMSARQAKRLNEIDARIAQIQNTPNSADEVIQLHQEKNTILNKIGTKDPDAIAAAKVRAFDDKAIADAKSELENAKEALAKRKAWEQQNPGKAKSDLQSKYSDGYKVRQDVEAAEQKLREMGVDFESTDTSLPDGIKAPQTGGSTATKGADDAPSGSTTAKGADDAPSGSSGAKGADETPSGSTAAKGATANTSTATAHYESDLARLETEFDQGVKTMLANTDGMGEAEVRAYQKWLSSKGYESEIEIVRYSRNDVRHNLKVSSNKPTVRPTKPVSPSVSQADAAGDVAATVVKNDITSKLTAMKTKTGLDDLIAVPAAKNSAGVDQYRLLVKTDENADDIVRNLNARGIKAGKIYVNSKSGGRKVYVAIADNAEDYAKLEKYVQAPKKVVPVADEVVKTGTQTAKKATKAEKLAAAKRAKRAGYHGTDANIADGDNIRWGKGSRSEFDGVSIARSRNTAENYAINRLIKNQNPHMQNSNFIYDMDTNVLTITSDTPLNLNNKTFYIYELAADGDDWISASNRYAGLFSAHYNKAKEGTEWLSKEAVNLDDLIARGRVKIDAPSAITPKPVVNSADYVDDVVGAASAAEKAEFASVYGRKASNVLEKENDVALFASPNKKTASDDAIFDMQEAYMREADNATSEAEEIAAWDKYHKKVLDYLETKFNPTKTRSVAASRRDMYLEAIASDENLSYTARNWATRTDRQRQEFMQNLVDRVNNGYCRGDKCTVGIKREGNWNNNNVSEINIDFDQTVAYRSDGVRVRIDPRNNLDDAMLALAHEHAHDITRYAPESSSLPEEYIGWSISHLETGRPEREFGRALNIKDYLRGIVEKEGFMIGEIVGKDFTKDLQRILGR